MVTIFECITLIVECYITNLQSGIHCQIYVIQLLILNIFSEAWKQSIQWTLQRTSILGVFYIITLNRLTFTCLLMKCLKHVCGWYRFKYEGIWRDKITAHVDFPVEQLDMSRYISGPKQRVPYNLFAVSVSWHCYMSLYIVDPEVTQNVFSLASRQVSPTLLQLLICIKSTNSAYWQRPSHSLVSDLII